MTNHEMFASALRSYKGKTLTTSAIRAIVGEAFRDFNMGSLRPNDHAEGNKSPCRCARTDERILDRVKRGIYVVR
jgi:hypothetical protein